MSLPGPSPRVPELPGVLSADQVAATARSITRTQEPDGAIPWSPGARTDVWNHVEAAMGALVGGEVATAEAAYDWCARWQRPDGSWPMRIVQGRVEDPSGETNMCAYLAVGIWHHWRLRHDLAYVERLWPVVRAGLDYVVGLQLSWGGIAWSQEYDEHGPARVNAEALLAGSASIYQALRAGVALAELVGESTGSWPAAGWATRCASTRDCSWTSAPSRWTGTTRSWAARSAAPPAVPWSTPAGTTSWCPGSASAASTPTPG